MSSSNLVRIAVIEEVTQGTTPGAGAFSTARFTSESLSGTPTTTESQTLRADRLSSGQIATGLEVGGTLSFELGADPVIDMFIESAMQSSWNVQATQTVDLTVVAATRLITRASGDWNATVEVGDILTLDGFVATTNNTQCQIIDIQSTTVIKVVFNETNGAVVDEVGSGTDYKRADKISIGTTQKYFSMEKAFLDLTTKAINYRGMQANSMELNVNYGEVISGSFEFNGTDYEPADAAGEFMTNARTIDAAATTGFMNGSIDMPFINSSATGVLDEADFCIQSASISLNNNDQATNCIGLSAPKGYSSGTAATTINLSTYLADSNWSVLAKKLTQEPFALGFMVKNLDGFYGFYLPAVQVSFPDPSSGGANQQISLEMDGTAKVGSAGENQLYLYRG